MKRLRWMIPPALVLAVAVGALFWPRGGAGGFATPDDCLEAYREACLAGDVPRYLSCLGEPLRSSRQRSANPESVRREIRGVKSWTQHAPVTEGTTARVDVDQVRLSGTVRVRFHLRHDGRGWQITDVEGPRTLPNGVPFGTPLEQTVPAE